MSEVRVPVLQPVSGINHIIMAKYESRYNWFQLSDRLKTTKLSRGVGLCQDIRWPKQIVVKMNLLKMIQSNEKQSKH